MRKWSDIREDLAQLLDVSRVKSRKVGGNTTIPYLEGEDVIRTANEIFGVDGWSGAPDGPVQRFQVNERSYLYSVPYLVEFYGLDEDGNIRTTYHGDIGKNTASSDNTNHHEMAISGCATDALKRAMRHLGDQFGLALYDKESDTFQEAMRVAKGGPAKKTTKSAPKKSSPVPDKTVSLEDKAKAYVVPDELPQGEVKVKPPLAGKTLAEVLENSSGRAVMGWLAGILETPVGEPPMSPSSELEEKLQAAAKYLYGLHFSEEEAEEEE